MKTVFGRVPWLLAGEWSRGEQKTEEETTGVILVQ
jgi:hypothetical protein